MRKSMQKIKANILKFGKVNILAFAVVTNLIYTLLNH